jgi:hypothetical protein
MKSPYSWSDGRDANIGFSQQHSLFRCVQICVFGDGVQGKGTPFPCISNREPQDGRRSIFIQAQETLRVFCERMRMKFSAGFLQWEPSRRPAVKSNRPTRDV